VRFPGSQCGLARLWLGFASADAFSLASDDFSLASLVARRRRLGFAATAALASLSRLSQPQSPTLGFAAAAALASLSSAAVLSLDPTDELALTRPSLSFSCDLDRLSSASEHFPLS
jgi:hypothetical protein